MALSVGEIEATLKLRDEMSAAVQQANQHLSNLGRTGTTTQTNMGGLGGGLRELANIFGVTFGAAAVGTAIYRLIDFGGQLDDLHLKTGISVAALQELKMAAELVGSSLPSVTTAITMMGRRLAGDDDSAAQAVAALGLNVDRLIAAGPEAAFRQIAVAIAAIPDPMQQSATAMAIFGRSGADLIPMFKKIAEGGDSTVKMSDDTVGALDLIGDTITRVKNNFMPWFILQAQQHTTLGRWTQGLLNLQSSYYGFLPLVRDAVRVHERWNTAARQGALIAPQGAEAMRLAGQATAALKFEYETIIRPQTEAREKQKKLNEEIDNLIDKALEARVPVSGLSSDFEYVAEQARQASLALYEFNSELIPLIPLATSTSDRFQDLAQNTDLFGQRLEETRFNAQRFREETEKADTDLGDLAQAFAQLAQVVGDSMSEIVRSIGGVIAGIETFSSSLDTFRSGGMTNWITGAAGMVGAVISIGTSLWNLGRALFGVSEEERKAREAIQNFEESLRDIATASQFAEAGTEDWKISVIVLRDAYMAMGHSEQEALAAAEQLWASSRSGTEAAQAAIEEINAVLTEHQRLLALTNEATELLRQATERYGFTIEELGPAMQAQQLHEMSSQLFTDWGLLIGSGIEIDTVAQRMSASVQEYLNIALATGTEVPEAMRPMIERMLEMGLLVDENGVALTDLSRIRWAETMTEGFDRVVAKLDELLSALGYALPATVISAATQIQNTLGNIQIEPIEIPIVWGDIPNDFGINPEDLVIAANIPSAQEGGYVKQGGLVNVHAGEQIVPARATPMDFTIRIPVLLEGRPLTEKIARHVLS